MPMRASIQRTTRWNSGLLLAQVHGRGISPSCSPLALFHLKNGQPHSPFPKTLISNGSLQCQNRGFISLPKLPELPEILKTQFSSSRHYKDRTIVKYSQQEFYDLVANVDDYHKFLPWCTHSKMSDPLAKKSDQLNSSAPPPPPGVTIRHGELGIGFNSLQERYVSTVTCQEPWTVRAVSYDSKLFKELATIWKFTPNVPKTTTLEATMDQELQSMQLLTKPEEYPLIQRPRQSPPPTQIEHQFTAAKVFGEAAVPKNWTQFPPSRSAYDDLPASPLSLKNSVERTPSPSNLATMKPSDYPSCWIDFEIQFEFASPVHASMSSLFFDQVSKEMLEAFIKRAEVLYGQR